MGKMRWLISAFTLVGLICMSVGAGWLIVTLHFLRHAQRVTGVVIENIERQQTESDSDGKQHEETYFYPRVRFRTATGQAIEFESSTGSDPPSHQPGETVTVLYDPLHPAKASLKDWSLWFGPGMFLGLGGVAVLLGTVGFIPGRRRKKTEAWLSSHGTRIVADFSGVGHSGNTDPDGEDTWHIVCQWLNPQTGRMHVFKSDSVPFDPAKFINSQQIAVTVDPLNFQRYSVDLSFLPGMTEKEERHWSSVASWPRRKLGAWREHWPEIKGSSLDALLLSFYHLCILGVLALDGTLAEKKQLLLFGILAAGWGALSLGQRRALGWRWPGPAEDMMQSLLIVGGLGTLALVMLGIWLPITHAAYLPVYLAVAGLLAFNVLRAVGMVVLTHAEFRQACPNLLPGGETGEVAWKRVARTAYWGLCAAVWLATIAWFFLYGAAVSVSLRVPAQMAKLSPGERALLLTPAQAPFLNGLRIALFIACGGLIVMGCLLCFALHIPLLPKRKDVKNAAETDLAALDAGAIDAVAESPASPPAAEA